MFRNIYIYNTHIYIYIYVYIYICLILCWILCSILCNCPGSGLASAKWGQKWWSSAWGWPQLTMAYHGIPWHTVFFILRRLEKSHDLVPVRIPNRNLRVRTSLLKLASNDVKAGCGAESGHWYLKGGSEVRADAKRPELRGFSQQIRIHFPRSGAFFHIL